MVVTLKGNINKHRNPKLLQSTSFFFFFKLTTKKAYPNVTVSVLFCVNNKSPPSLTQQFLIPAL